MLSSKSFITDIGSDRFVIRRILRAGTKRVGEQTKKTPPTRSVALEMSAYVSTCYRVGRLCVAPNHFVWKKCTSQISVVRCFVLRRVFCSAVSTQTWGGTDQRSILNGRQSTCNAVLRCKQNWEEEHMWYTDCVSVIKRARMLLLFRYHCEKA